MLPLEMNRIRRLKAFLTNNKHLNEAKIKDYIESEDQPYTSDQLEDFKQNLETARTLFKHKRDLGERGRGMKHGNDYMSYNSAIKTLNPGLPDNLRRSISSGLSGRNIRPIRYKSSWSNNMYELGVLDKNLAASHRDLEDHAEHVIKNIKNSKYNLSDLPPDIVEYIADELHNIYNINRENTSDIVSNVLDKH